jgi:hypothetical protein
MHFAKGGMFFFLASAIAAPISTSPGMNAPDGSLLEVRLYFTDVYLFVGYGFT